MQHVQGSTCKTLRATPGLACAYRRWAARRARMNNRYRYAPPGLFQHPVYVPDMRECAFNRIKEGDSSHASSLRLDNENGVV